MKEDKNPNDNLIIILVTFVIVLVGSVAGSFLIMEKKLNESYATPCLYETRGTDELVPHKKRFDIIFIEVKENEDE